MTYAGITIDPNDDDLYEGDETFTITFSNLVNVSGTGDDLTATGTIIDDETQPDLSIFDASATEGDDIIFLVDLIGPLTEEDVTFNYATSRESDDNSESNDFTRTTGTGTITAGNSAAIITVPTYDDGTNGPNSLYEGNETFTFTIFNPTVAAILHATAKGTILDDERIPIAAVLDSTHIASENAGTIPTFIDFEIGPRNERPSQISLSISGTATQGDDYSITTTINVPRNINQFSAPLTIIDDFRYELTETAVVTLVSASDNIQVDPELQHQNANHRRQRRSTGPGLRRAAGPRQRRRRSRSPHRQQDRTDRRNGNGRLRDTPEDWSNSRHSRPGLRHHVRDPDFPTERDIQDHLSPHHRQQRVRGHLKAIRGGASKPPTCFAPTKF